MKPTHVSILKSSAFAATLLTAPAAFAGLIVGAPVDVVGNLPLATFVGNNFATQSYKDWGNEPFLAVNPTNTNDIVVSSFAFETPRNSQASIFYSTNGGTSWTLQKTIPPPSASVGVPRDWNFTYNSSGVLHGTILGTLQYACLHASLKQLVRQRQRPSRQYHGDRNQ
jgi:hypothetical protein